MTNQTELNGAALSAYAGHMTKEEREAAVQDHLNWCREMLTNASIGIAFAESGAKLLLVDPYIGETDLTDADLTFNRRTVETIRRYFVAQGISELAEPLVHGGRGDH